MQLQIILIGILTGSLLFAAFIAGVLVGASRRERLHDQLDSISQRGIGPLFSNPSAEILEPIDEKAEALKEVLDENSERGLDTKISDL